MVEYFNQPGEAGAQLVDLGNPLGAGVERDHREVPRSNATLRKYGQHDKDNPSFTRARFRAQGEFTLFI